MACDYCGVGLHTTDGHYAEWPIEALQAEIGKMDRKKKDAWAVLTEKVTAANYLAEHPLKKIRVECSTCHMDWVEGHQCRGKS